MSYSTVEVSHPTKFAEQYAKLIETIEREFAGNPERVDRLKVFYHQYKDRLAAAPASTKEHFHNSYPGGYLDHILRVIDATLLQVKAYKHLGGIFDFTRSEAIFAAMHHDLGKLGDEAGPQYIEETSKWHRDRGANYKYNTDMQYMTVFDRTMYLLSQYDIKYTKNEMLGIKLADGLYAEGNEKYFKSFDPYAMKSSLPYLIHWADHMATIVEKTAKRVEKEGQ